MSTGVLQDPMGVKFLRNKIPEQGHGLITIGHALKRTGNRTANVFHAFAAHRTRTGAQLQSESAPS
jgi:hypothetical protein